ncbi:MAG: hypothetical protein R2780_15625, partial [Crocinitomicaceae bacterium]
TLSGQSYLLTVKEKESKEPGSKIKFLRIKLLNDSIKYSFDHVLYEGIGDCNSESLEIGGYRLTDTTIILYSFWCHMGDAPVSPWGARKQIFVPDSTGKLLMFDSELYIEAGNPGWEETKGVEFLHQIPETNDEKLAYVNYIHRMEKIYKADFVYGKEANDLLAEVRNQLRSEITKHTSHWNKNAPFGFKR